MSKNASLARSEELLARLLRLIAVRDLSAASRLLTETPELARLAVQTGATRQGAENHFFDEIAHYAYAGDTALHFAAAAYQREMAKELLSMGADVHARNRRGAQPLHYAADGSILSKQWNPHSQAEVIELLIAAGADPNAEDKSGVTPLHRAVRTRSASAVQALLDNGANPFMTNGSGSTPLHLAVQNTGRGGSGTEASREQQSAIIRLLLSHGARPSDRNSSGKSVEECVKSDWIRSLLSGRRSD